MFRILTYSTCFYLSFHNFIVVFLRYLGMEWRIIFECYVLFSKLIKYVINHYDIPCYDKIWKKSRDIRRFRPIWMRCKLHIDLVVYPLWCNVHCRGKLCTKWKQYQKQKEKIFKKNFLLILIICYFYLLLFYMIKPNQTFLRVYAKRSTWRCCCSTSWWKSRPFFVKTLK